MNEGNGFENKLRQTTDTAILKDGLSTSAERFI